MKEKIPVMGIDDGGFQLFSPEWNGVDVFGVVMRGHHYVEGITKTTILKDDPDPTTRIIEMVEKSGHRQNLKAIIHQGVTIGGFGVIDPQRVYTILKVPFIAVMKRKPDFEKIKEALKNLPDGEERWNVIQKHPMPKIMKEGIFIQATGIDFETATQIIKCTIAVGNMPEALRIAHMIGKAVYDEKKGQI